MLTINYMGAVQPENAGMALAVVVVAGVTAIEETIAGLGVDAVQSTDSARRL